MFGHLAYTAVDPAPASDVGGVASHRATKLGFDG
jgi:hypothetical protein